MPKMKPNKAAVKRFRVTARGKVLYAHAGRRHLLSSKKSKRRRQLRRQSLFGGANVGVIRRLVLKSAVRGRRASAVPAVAPAPSSTPAPSSGDAGSKPK